METGIERQMMDFYQYMKRKADEENHILRSTQSKLPTSFETQLAKHNAAIKENFAAQDSERTPQKKKEIQAAVDALQTWLHIETEALLETTKATKGAVYLKSNDGYLRRVIEIPSTQSGTGLPRDVGLAAGSTIGTVFTHRVGVNVTKSRYEAQTDNVLSSSTVLKIRNGVAMPILTRGGNGVLGVVIIADKDGPGSFSGADEHAVHGFATMAKGVLARYSHTHFLSPPQVDMTQTMKAVAQLPAVTKGRGQLDLKMPNASFSQSMSQTMPLSDEMADSSSVPARTGRQLVVRSDGSASNVVSKDLQVLPSSELSEEDVLESSAPYVRHVEGLWRKALDNITQLRQECGRWDDTVNQKNNVIIELEIQLKSLQKQMSRLKSDVAKIKSVVPQHLREVNGLEPAPPPDRKESTGGALQTHPQPSAPLQQSVRKSHPTRTSVPALPQVPTSSRRSTHHAGDTTGQKALTAR